MLSNPIREKVDRSVMPSISGRCIDRSAFPGWRLTKPGNVIVVDFSASTSWQNWIVPSVDDISAYLWGAGGAPTYSDPGAGGYTAVDIPVSPGETLEIYAGTYHGAAAIRRGGVTLLAVAGGGGQGQSSAGTSRGGAGGGANGQAGYQSYAPGTSGGGGTQSSGGSGGGSNIGYPGTNGTQNLARGGSRNDGYAGCHGGGGYWGGGGGGTSYYGASNYFGGGGGGSGYINTTQGVVGNTYTGDYASPPSEADNEYWDGSSGNAGQEGKVVIVYKK